MSLVPVMGSPWAPTRQRLVQSKSVPMGIRRAAPNEAGVDVHVEQDGVVIGGCSRASGTEDARKCSDVRERRLFVDVEGCSALRDDSEGGQRGVGRQERRHPFGIGDDLLDDPISPVGGILVKVDPHSTLLVAMLDDDSGRLQVRADRNAQLISLLEERPLVLHPVPDWHVVEQGVQPDHVAVQSPVGKPIIRRQQPRCELSAQGILEFGEEPLLQRRYQADGRVRRHEESHGHPAAAHEEGEREAGSWDCDVAEVVDKVVAVASLAIVRLVVEVEGGGQTEQVDAGVLLEELGLVRIGRPGLQRGRELGVVAADGVLPVPSWAEQVVQEALVVGRRVRDHGKHLSHGGDYSLLGLEKRERE
mmetsp:Transcript_1907/g.4696  ORF Transcript_1907/g.4696 Transcript_1907/m.4696 type:complete len:362 (+) Transcript_1907:430-1515(+)